MLGRTAVGFVSGVIVEMPVRVGDAGAGTDALMLRVRTVVHVVASIAMRRIAVSKSGRGFRFNLEQDWSENMKRLVALFMAQPALFVF